MKSVASLALLVLLAAGVADAFRFRKAKAPTDETCGKGFDALNPGSQEYFFSIEKSLWTHPGRNEQFGTFEAELKCWFSYMLTMDCGGLKPVARKQKLAAACKDPHVDWLKIWKFFSKEEFTWYKKNFPNDEAGTYTGNHKETMNTMLELNKKELLCMTLFTIDDECVKHKYVKMPGVTMPASSA